jgi:hypothetical protein
MTVIGHHRSVMTALFKTCVALGTAIFVALIGVKVLAPPSAPITPRQAVVLYEIYSAAVLCCLAVVFLLTGRTPPPPCLL